MPDPTESEPEPETAPQDAPAPAEASLEDLVAALGDPSSRRAPSVDPMDPAAYADLDLADELPVDPDDDLREVDGDASPRLVSIVESLLFASSKALRVRDIRRLLKEPTKRQVQLALKHIMTASEKRGVVLGQVAGGFRFRTHPENAEYVQRLIAGRPVRLSRSQLETLAVIAYRQPVTKSEVDHIRGVDCGAVLRLLLERDLAKIVGRKEEPGRPHVYGTSVKFLEFFNLRSLRDMPDLHEFRELSDESAMTLREELGDPPDHEGAEQEDMGQETLPFAGDDAEDDRPDTDGSIDDAGLDADVDQTAEPAQAEAAHDGDSDSAATNDVTASAGDSEDASAGDSEEVAAGDSEDAPDGSSEEVAAGASEDVPDDGGEEVAASDIEDAPDGSSADAVPDVDAERTSQTGPGDDAVAEETGTAAVPDDGEPEGSV